MGSGIREFIRAFRAQWLAAMSGSASVPFAVAGTLASNWSQWILLGAAVFCGALSSYLVWKKERDRADSLATQIASRKALDILRASGEPLSSWELARRILISMDKETDEKSVLMLAKTIHSSLSRQKIPVVRLDRSAWPGKWRLLPP